MIIMSATNERVKDIRKLTKSSKERREQGVFIVEGIRMFKEIPRPLIKEIYVSEAAQNKYQEELAEIELEPYIVRDSVFASMSDTGSPQGILAVVGQQTYELCDLYREKAPFILIIDRLQDPGNLGTIIRTAEGAGVSGIMLSTDSVDLYNPKVVRATMGSIFRMPIYESSDMVGDINLLKEQKLTIYGAHLSGDTFYENQYTGGCGFLIGNEGNGLTMEVSKTADRLIKIPMMGNVESLNAATSVAVIAYEVLRQRNF